MHSSHSVVSLLVGTALLAMCCSAYAAEDVQALIKRQSQEFSDASASGDAAVLARDLDDHVIFMNESGEIATKKDIVDSASPSPKGQSNSLTQTDFKLEMHGAVAVTSFTDVLTQQFHGQTLHAK
ncbi:MAG TPA: nuclear transport factor 2 family protein, partial [Xanthomonadaceae bacterium]|nr:nuclear transport factor 2 family protein [Xanthomonadaceae bacterium]